MTRAYPIIIFLLTFASFTRAEPSDVSQTSLCQHDRTTFRCVRFLKNYDGDTITFQIPDVHPLLGDKIAVRVNGIDTAEVRTKNSCEKASARAARNLVTSILSRAKSIELRNITRGKYFRIVADVYFDGNSLKQVLVQNRLAVAYDGGTKVKVNWCNMGKRAPATNQ